MFWDELFSLASSAGEAAAPAADTALTVGQTVGENALADVIPAAVDYSVGGALTPWWEGLAQGATQAAGAVGNWGATAGSNLATWAAANPGQALTLGTTGGLALANALRSPPEIKTPMLPSFTPTAAPLAPPPDIPPSSPLLRRDLERTRTVLSPNTGGFAVRPSTGLSAGL